MNNTLNSQMLQCECPLLAQSGLSEMSDYLTAFGAKRTSGQVAACYARTLMTLSGPGRERNPAVQRWLPHSARRRHEAGHLLRRACCGRCHSRLRRYSVGVCPVIRRNAALSALVVLKPTSSAISVMDAPGFASKAFARSIRRTAQ